MGSAAVSSSVPAPTAQEQFTSALRQELAGDALELPSYPDIALRVRKALGNPDVAIDEVVRLVSAEPSLAVRLLQLANSAALNPSGQRITMLRVAIARIGFNLARSATIAFAMSQMRRAEAWRGLEERFRELWEDSANLAATSHVLAKRVRGIIADQAMLAAMLQAVGRLFVLTRLKPYPVLLNDAQRYEALQREWHVPVSRALLTRWEVGPEIVAAASGYEAAGERQSGAADLSDVLFIARRIVALPPGAKPVAEDWKIAPFERLGLDLAVLAEVISASTEEIASLRTALLD